jgi:hypothetical protein
MATYSKEQQAAVQAVWAPFFSGAPRPGRGGDKAPPAAWDLPRHGAGKVVQFGRPGDDLDPRRGSPADWRALRRLLAGTRGLHAVALGDRCFLAPPAALTRANAITDLAQRAELLHDSAAAAVLLDLLDECGLPRGAAGAVRAACARRPVPLGDFRPPGADGRGPLDVPGGDPWEEEAPPPGRRGKGPPAAKLSRLQLATLRFALDCGRGGAPLALLRQGASRTRQAALSRALRRLEARGLAALERDPAGRAVRVSLTDAGRQALETVNR